MDRDTKLMQPKKKNIIVRILLFLLALAVVLLAIGIIVFRDHLNVDSVKRWFTYRALTLSDSGQADSFRYSGSSDDVFLTLDGDLLVCSGNAISLYSGSGTQYIDQTVAMTSPAADAKGGTAVIYDAGGSELYVFRQRALVYTLNSTGTILSARLNSSGLLTVVTQETGYRGVVTVYDASYQPKSALRLSSSYIMDAALADDGKTLSVVTIGQQNGSFSSSLSVYDMSKLSTDISYDFSPVSTCSLGSNVILGLGQNAGQIWTLGDHGLTVLNQQAEILGTVDWSDRYLKMFGLGGSDFAVALLGKYRAGSQAELVAVDSKGVQIGSLELNEQVLSLSAAGRYFAVLTADRLDIYTSDMTLYSTLEGTQSARKVLLREDGTAVLISTQTARLYVPS